MDKQEVNWAIFERQYQFTRGNQVNSQFYFQQLHSPFCSLVLSYLAFVSMKARFELTITAFETSQHWSEYQLHNFTREKPVPAIHRVAGLLFWMNQSDQGLKAWSLWYLFQKIIIISQKLTILLVRKAAKQKRPILSRFACSKYHKRGGFGKSNCTINGYTSIASLEVIWNYLKSIFG